MRQVLRSVGHSEKVDLALGGEKGVGILAFALIAQELHLSSCHQDEAPSACLVLRRDGLRGGKGEVLSPCPQHARSSRGTTAYLIGILPEAAASLTWKRLKEYLGREFSADLRRNGYDLVLEAGGRWEPVRPQRFRGLSVLSQTLPLSSSGHATVELHVLPVAAPDALVSLYGRGGIRVCPLSATPYGRVGALKAMFAATGPSGRPIRPPWYRTRLTGNWWPPCGPWRAI
jgi:hypothetical protein